MAHTLADVTAAANDPHLRDRLISAAAEAGIDSPDQWVDTRVRLLAAAPVNSAGDTVASVYAYAAGQMPPPPGENPAAVTDTFLRAALANVQP